MSSNPNKKNGAVIAAVFATVAVVAVSISIVYMTSSNNHTIQTANTNNVTPSYQSSKLSSYVPESSYNSSRSSRSYSYGSESSRYSSSPSSRSSYYGSESSRYSSSQSSRSSYYGSESSRYSSSPSSRSSYYGSESSRYSSSQSSRSSSYGSESSRYSSSQSSKSSSSSDSDKHTYTFFDRTGTYEGDWKNNQPDGYGTFTYKKSSASSGQRSLVYSGNWKNGMANGGGDYLLEASSDKNYQYIRYIANFLNNKINDDQAYWIKYFSDGTYIIHVGKIANNDLIGAHQYKKYDSKGQLVEQGYYENGTYTSNEQSEFNEMMDDVLERADSAIQDKLDEDHPFLGILYRFGKYALN